VPLQNHTLLDLAKVLSEHQIDVLICGGISREEREFLAARRVEIVENVVGSVRELIDALQRGVLRSGFGLATSSGNSGDRPSPPALQGVLKCRAREPGAQASLGIVDCLACRHWRCLQGEQCELVTPSVSPSVLGHEIDRMLEASLDISSEEERTLCRLSELIYFCLEMQYQHIGVAYCVDLQEPSEILVRVLRLFFNVYPVCSKIGGTVVSALLNGRQLERGQRAARCVACNPAGQAGVLNRMGTYINVLVGLCMGADCIFARFSDAPVTTLFVKDKSLANNPIGAVYSDYYLKEAVQAAPHGLGEESKERFR
jgi:uncharacterized metal-binding protein